jgi:hypothetical protein
MKKIFSDGIAVCWVIVRGVNGCEIGWLIDVLINCWEDVDSYFDLLGE